MITFLRAHKRLTVIIFLWIVFCGFFIIPNWHEGPEPLYFLVFSIGFVTLISAQLFWIGAILAFGKRFISGKPQRIWLAIIDRCLCALLGSQLRRWGQTARGRLDPFDDAQACD